MDSIGTQSATLTTALGVRACEPRCILSIGTCGALARKGAEIGDLYLATDRVWYHARRIPLPGWHEYGRGGYPTAGDAELAASIGARAGILSTADSLDFPDLDAGVFESLGADMADMEGAAVAWVAHMHGLPFYALKGVTDLMDSPRPVGSQFQENFAALSEKIGDASLRLIDALIN
jgi:nucleoside phosphorylase